MRKKPLLAFDELEHAHDVSVKLLGRLQLAVGGDDDNWQASASEAIEKCETFG